VDESTRYGPFCWPVSVKWNEVQKLDQNCGWNYEDSADVTETAIVRDLCWAGLPLQQWGGRRFCIFISLCMAGCGCMECRYSIPWTNPWDTSLARPRCLSYATRCFIRTLHTFIEYASWQQYTITIIKYSIKIQNEEWCSLCSRYYSLRFLTSFSSAFRLLLFVRFIWSALKYEI